MPLRDCFLELSAGDVPTQLTGAGRAPERTEHVDQVNGGFHISDRGPRCACPTGSGADLWTARQVRLLRTGGRSRALMPSRRTEYTAQWRFHAPGAPGLGVVPCNWSAIPGDQEALGV